MFRGTYVGEKLSLRSAGAALFVAFVVLVAIRPSAGPISLPSGDHQVSADESYAKLPLSFEPNRGRMDPGIDYVARTGAGSAYLSDTGAKLAFADGERTSSVELRLLGAARSEPVAMGRLPGSVNDLRGDDASRWQTGIPTFERVRYWAYPGISLDWHGDRRALEYSFNLTTGADPDQIALRVKGAERLSLAADGDLLIHAGQKTIRQAAPVAFQPGPEGARKPVEARFALHGNTVGFELGAYDRTRPLVIDPVVLDYSTYLGGSGADAANGIAVDDAGAAYLTGRTASTDFDTAGQVEGDEADTDVFVTKLSPDGEELEYSTYVGGNLADRGNDIAVDSAGAAYVVGTTRSTDFNTVNQLYGPRNDGAKEDAFFLKLDPSGGSLLYSTYFGSGSGGLLDGAGPGDEGLGVAVGPTGAAYVAGNTDGQSQAGTAHNALPLVSNAGSCVTEQPDSDTSVFVDPTEQSDVFVAKFDPTQGGSASLAYSTCLSGGRGDGATGIAVDATGAAYVTGTTNSSDFQTTPDPIDGDSGGVDAFVTKLSAAGNTLAYSTYLGGDDFDAAYDIALDATGAAYIAGTTSSPGTTSSDDFDVKNEIEGDSIGPDAFAAKLNPAGSGLDYATYLGGTGGDAANGIAVDSTGAAYLTGETGSADFDLGGQLESDSGGTDAFVSSLTPTGSLSCSTYLGGGAPDAAKGIDVGSPGAAYVAGSTQSSDFDTADRIEGDSGSSDAFASKLDLSGPCDPAPQGQAQAPDKGLRVYVVVLDGLRPGEIDPNLTPNLNDLKEDGTWYEEARSVMIAETLPNHAAMMTGALSARNGVVGNSYHSRGFGGGSKSYMHDPRLLEAESLTTTLEESCDVSSSVVQSKWYLWKLFSGEQANPDDPALQRLADYHYRPEDSPTYITKPDEHTIDASVMREGFLPWFHTNPPLPHFAFLNLGDIDRSGHADESGALTMGQLSGFRQAALSATDNLVGSWIDELREPRDDGSSAWDETVLIFTSDHGMDWSLPHNRVQPTGGQSVLNGGAAMVYVPAGGDIAQVAQTNADQDGVEFVATRDGIGGFPSLEEIGIDNPNTGDVVLFAEPGWRFIQGDAENPVPGNHGHSVTQHSTLFVTGGHPALAEPPTGGRSVDGELVYDPDNRRVAPAAEGPGNLSIAPTVAKLFGLDPPEGGYDGQPLDAAFDDWAFEPHVPCGASGGPRSTSDDDDDGGTVGGESPAGAPASQFSPGAAPHRKGCKRFKSKRKRRACARKKKR